MGPRLLFLSVLVLIIFTDHSQGVPETFELSPIDSPVTVASPVGNLPTTSHPIVIVRRHKRPCNCKGLGGETVKTRCLCQQSTTRNQRKWKKFCQLHKYKNLKRCKLTTVKPPSVPSVPI
ncbi:uncharacterized protein PAE49_005368 [Odontesthes bonariensis]